MMTEVVDKVVAGVEKMFAPIEVAMILGYKQATVQEMCRTGRIKAKKMGSQWRIPESELRRFIEEGPSEEGSTSE